ncbi:MAG: serine/threonine protein kinase [Sandaracinaceae bacterium]|nr:serine/threonine protein kinase [Sandaracinaceae bacterium]
MSDPVSSHPDEDQSYEAWVGRVIDSRYRIDGLLGEGGMGAVFEAEHLKLMKKVALKVIHPEFAGDGEVAERFVREAMASAQLEHPHVATATDYGTLPEGGGYLVMQFVRGESLRDVIDRDGAVDWIRSCEIMAQVADALSSAHKKGIVHRDLKPDNVMLEPRDDGTSLVKVLDFGIARVASDGTAGRTGPALTRVGTVIGTPGYMAPEQALGERVDFKVDLYAVGLLLYEMITGEPVFDGHDLTAIVTRQLTEEIVPLADKAKVPPELNALVTSALSRDKDARPESAGVMRETLRGLVLGATLQAHASGEVAIPALGTTELAGASRREPTPMRVSLPAIKEPPVVQARETSPRLVTAKTQLAIDAVKKRSLPLSLLAAVGCGGMVMLTILGVVVVSLMGGDDVTLRKGEGRAAPVAQGDDTPPPPDEPAGLDPTPEPPAPRPATTIPDPLSQAYANLLLSERAATRRSAGREILAYEPRTDVPEFVVELSELESTTVCARRRDHVVRLGEIGDPRALPALERLDATPRNECRRMFNRYDCLGCLRDELGTALESLRSQM